MASKTYKTRALILKKTKLREKDLIVTLIDENGMLLQGVAKGARKPGGSLAARLELFSLVDVLMAQGCSLDVVCEARLVEGGVRSIGMEQGACAAPVAELLTQIAQANLTQSRLFELASASFIRIAAARSERALMFSAASLWKVLAQAGFKPSLRSCALCGNEIDFASDIRITPLSINNGGVICDLCPRPADALTVATNTLAWIDFFIASTFNEIDEHKSDTHTLFDVLDLARAWSREYAGRDLKSLDFLFTAGLF